MVISEKGPRCIPVCEGCLISADRQAWWTDRVHREGTQTHCEVCDREEVCVPLTADEFTVVVERL